jgi:hypothetical protein
MIPYIEAIHRAYQRAGLTVIGVHSPEFAFEKEVENVERAIRDFGIKYPVVLDSEFKIWDLYANKYWPHLFLVDHRGDVVYDHAGEGAIAETEHAILEALHASGVKQIPDRAEFHAPSIQNGVCYRPTPELYCGYLRGHIGNAIDALPETEEAFTDGGNHESGVVYIHGHWRISSEYIEHTRSLPAATEYCAFSYHGFSVHVVMGALDDREVMMEVFWDGKPIPATMAGKDVVIDTVGNTHIHVSTHRMYDVIAADHFHDATVKLACRFAGVKIYAITFGGCRS